MLAIGVDIGGTKCAACLGRIDGSQATVLRRCSARPTAGYTSDEMLEALLGDIRYLCSSAQKDGPIAGIGISCGGSINSHAGVILSPLNLPGWNNVRIAKFFSKNTDLPAWLCNDANAGALAEWKFGAGQGSRNMAYLTFGTGMGAGLILGGKLYEGSSGVAGEIGHLRLSTEGPSGYGKSGSFEGFCSGGGIAQLARTFAARELDAGRSPELCPDRSMLDALTAQRVGEAAKDGDPLAIEILTESGSRLGAGLAILIDLLNLDRIVIGNIFVRCYGQLWPAARQVVECETLEDARAACVIVPSTLNELAGDIAALSVVAYHLEQQR